MNAKQECERLRGENDRLRAAFTAAVGAIEDMRGRLDILEPGLATMTAAWDETVAGVVAGRRAPLDAKARAKEKKIARALELRASGMSVARIAQIMHGEKLLAGTVDSNQRSVRRWLAVLAIR